MSANPAPGFQKYPDHQVAITATTDNVTIRIGDLAIARSNRTLSLRESRYPQAHYIPLEDVRTDLLTDSNTETYCPFKGKARYYNLNLDGRVVEDALWYYPEPYDECQALIGTVAFYADKVAIEISQDMPDE
ncbi:MAG: DUF427 domain-containing protein [Pseudomonadota bacterium]